MHITVWFCKFRVLSLLLTYDMFSFSGEYCDCLNSSLDIQAMVSLPANSLPSSSVLFCAVSTGNSTPFHSVAGPSSAKPFSQTTEKCHVVSAKHSASVCRDKLQPPSAPSTTLRPDVWIGHSELPHWKAPDFLYLKRLSLGSDEALKVFQHLAKHENPPKGWQDDNINPILILYDLVQFYWCTSLGESSGTRIFHLSLVTYIYLHMLRSPAYIGSDVKVRFTLNAESLSKAALNSTRYSPFQLINYPRHCIFPAQPAIL